MERPERAALTRNPSLRAGTLVGSLLLLAYVLTLAPGVTYWDAGEFLAAIRTLGIPHPPGTPLYVLIGNVWARVFAPLLGFAYAVNLLSAVCTAGACGIFAYLMARWTSDSRSAIAGGLLSGLMSSVWLNANETEVYASSLLMAALLILVANQVNESDEPRWLILLGYLFGLGWALQISCLVAAPAALFLAFSRLRARRIPVAAMITAGVLGASVVVFMIIRAQHDPAVNQGNPATWAALENVITRRQYLPAGFFPRQAPWYLQIGNLFEYADWQVALGLHPEAPPSLLRTPFTLLYGWLGVRGFFWHRDRDRLSWRVLTVLFVSGTLGIVAYLNMKTSPSYGFGILPPDALHEARERDYFFVLGFIAWGLWAGAGAVQTFSRFSRKWSAAGLAIAGLPFALNFPATDRAHRPESTAALDSARRILQPALANAVIIAYGDNDTYPVWYAQQVEGARRDVTLVTIPLLGADWYRAELARRHQLLEPRFVNVWRGFASTLNAICTAAERTGRPVVATDVPESPPIPMSCKRNTTEKTR